MNDITKYRIAEFIRLTSLIVIVICAAIFLGAGIIWIGETVKLHAWPWYIVCAFIIGVCAIAFWAAGFIFPINEKPEGYGAGDGR